MKSIQVLRATTQNAPTVFSLIARLLNELGEEGNETGPLDEYALAKEWEAREDQCFTFLALGSDSVAIGVITVVETFAIYAGGPYGIINEMYVVPEYRSNGIGTRLIEPVVALAHERGWKRVDVTAPESAGWDERNYSMNARDLCSPDQS
jgi:GNAT superfamily N-acetyltransferase